MSLKTLLSKHEHSLITFGVVLVATLAGYGLYTLILMAGFWLGREHSQAEYRFMSKFHLNRESLGFFDGCNPLVWNYDSFVNDLVLPIVVGGLIVGVSLWIK